MTKFIGSTEKIIEWDDIILHCRNEMCGYLNSVENVLHRSKLNWEKDSDLSASYKDIVKMWEDAGYDLEKIQWTNYYPKIHFSEEIEKKFADIVNADPKKVWISEILPGRCAPYHWDVDDSEKQWLSEGNLKRYVCFIDKPKFGHVFIIENDMFYQKAQHEIYEWDHYRNYHGGVNCGSEPYYLFHFLGTPK